MHFSKHIKEFGKPAFYIFEFDQVDHCSNSNGGKT